MLETIKKIRIRTKIIIPTILILIISNLVSVFTSAYKMDDLAKTNAKVALNQLTDSIFLNLRTAMNTGNVDVIKDAEEKSRNNIPGLEKLVVSRSKDMISMFSPNVEYTQDPQILKAFDTKKDAFLESFENNKHTIRSIRPMVATSECVVCHSNQNVGDVIGVIDLTFNLEASDNIINSTVLNLIIQAIIVLIFVTIFMTVLIRKATKPIDVFQKGLETFFRFINKEQKEVGHIEGYSNDEIGALVDSVNRNIDETVKGVKKDEKLISEAKEVCKKASLGLYDVKITTQAHSPELNDLKELVNKLISSTGYNINRVAKVLGAYDQNDYTSRINSKGNTQGTLKEVFDKVDILGESLMDNARTNLQNGMKLDEDAQLLEQNVSKIQKLLSKQVQEIEDGVNSLSNMTNEINDTTNNAVSMANYAKNVTSSVSQGHNLANQTTKQMQEIANQVGSINEAINIIDEIAFQTNILSLNAAVEAATAGEAGKGFAVVAGEVRNLANRSAQAASEIKALVESATLKANEGKDISTTMIKGYDELNEHMDSTMKLIQDVTQASQSQQKQIETINHKMVILKDDTKETTDAVTTANDIAVSANKLATTIVEDAQSKKIN